MQLMFLNNSLKVNSGDDGNADAMLAFFAMRQNGRVVSIYNFFFSFRGTATNVPFCRTVPDVARDLPSST